MLYCSVTWTSCCSPDIIDKIFRLQKRYYELSSTCEEFKFRGYEIQKRCARLILDAPKTP